MMIGNSGAARWIFEKVSGPQLSGKFRSSSTMSILPDPNRLIAASRVEAASIIKFDVSSSPNPDSNAIANSSSSSTKRMLLIKVRGWLGVEPGRLALILISCFQKERKQHALYRTVATRRTRQCLGRTTQRVVRTRPGQPQKQRKVQRLQIA